ncbi:MAG TPA: MarR family transcriptional regulator [Myxococcaceae bacterium]|jgi:DNA-binding MarR family transcriptional regulator|nr:MarR family transcriptional regulator [Myxococcaceae bacterium]
MNGSFGIRSPSFLLAQVGAHAAAKFAERLASTGLTPAHAGILRIIANGPGTSQRALASTLGMLPSRLVTLVDELETKGLIERRDNPDDRRLHALHLTERGGKAMMEIGRVARAHGEALCAALKPAEREQLSELLGRIADEQGLTPGVHPGFKRIKPDEP